MHLQLALTRLEDERTSVLQDLRLWLGHQAPLIDHSVSMIEVFTGKANLSRVMEAQSGMPCIRLGLEYGQDFTKPRDRQLFIQLLAVVKPKRVWYSWPCKCWGPWSRLNAAKTASMEENIRLQHQIAPGICRWCQMVGCCKPS